MTSSRIDAIQGLRAFAALLVVADHSISSLMDAGSLDPRNMSFAWMLGGMGVKIFFVISGFIMTITSHKDFATPDASKHFLWKRLSRIAPLYWIITLVAAVKLSIVHRAPRLIELATSFLFIPWLNDAGEFRPVHSVGWTLNYEMFFYIIFAVALNFKIFRGLSGLCMFLVILVTVNVIGQPGLTGTRYGSALTFWGDSIVLYFVAGIGIGLCRIQFDNAFARLGIGLYQGLIGALLLVFIYATYAFTYFSSDPGSPWEIFACVGAVTVCAAAIDCNGAKRPFVCSLGDASYSIYLTHGFLIGISMRVYIQVFGRHAPALFVATMVFCACVLGILTYRQIEKPLLRIIRNLKVMPVRSA